MHILPADFSDPQLLSLLTLHVADMRDSSPAGFSFALDLSGLQSAGVRLFTAWDERTLLGCGALKELSPTSGEIKSMRTDPRHLRRGVGTAILLFIIDEATRRGYSRLSLETGTGAQFDAAVALYRHHGFIDGEPFADYVASPHNQFLHRALMPRQST